MAVAADPVFGVILHAVGGFAAGSFYIPYKRVRGWSWESYWLIGGIFSWVLAPWIAAFLTVPDLIGVLKAAPSESLVLCYAFGVMWGIGGLTFGLAMRYLGVSLGYALALGFCAVFGTLIPPFYSGTLAETAAKHSGQVTLLGLAVCLAGIALCCLAGKRKEREATSGNPSVAEFSFWKGLWLAVFAGVMSSCMALGFFAGAPIAELARKSAEAHGGSTLWCNNAVLVVVLAGGFTVNALWCIALNSRNRTGTDYFKALGGATPFNYLWCAIAGVAWFLQFFFYGMGTTKMGRFDFSSWTIHMAFIIVFSTAWGFLLSEWRGSATTTRRLVLIGLAVLIASTVVVGLGTYIEAHSKAGGG